MDVESLRHLGERTFIPYGGQGHLGLETRRRDCHGSVLAYWGSLRVAVGAHLSSYPTCSEFRCHFRLSLTRRGYGWAGGSAFVLLEVDGRCVVVTGDNWIT
jgi:hypothetical protein